MVVLGCCLGGEGTSPSVPPGPRVPGPAARTNSTTAPEHQPARQRQCQTTPGPAEALSLPPSVEAGYDIRRARTGRQDDGATGRQGNRATLHYITLQHPRAVSSLGCCSSQGRRSSGPHRPKFLRDLKPRKLLRGPPAVRDHPDSEGGICPGTRRGAVRARLPSLAAPLGPDYKYTKCGVVAARRPGTVCIYLRSHVTM